jgi:GIY-YIG catalytic domain
MKASLSVRRPPARASDQPNVTSSRLREATSGTPDFNGEWSFQVIASGRSRGPMFHIHVIVSEKFTERYYIGFSTQIEQRLAEHNCGKNPSTSKYRPWRLAAARILVRAIERGWSRSLDSGHSRANRLGQKEKCAHPERSACVHSCR